MLCDQGGERMDVHENITSTLRAQAHHPPVVMESAGFCTEHSANARSIGYEEEMSPTLRAGTVPAALSYFSNHSQDTRYTGPEEISQTVSATFGMGGNNQPFIVHTPQTLKIRGGKSGGGKGAIWQSNMSATLSTNNDQVLFDPKCYGICSTGSNAMQSDNPNSGFYEADTARTIDTSTQSPTRNQGGMAVVQTMKSYDVRFTSDGSKVQRQNVYETDVARTLDSGAGQPQNSQGGVAVVSIQGSMIGRKDENGPQGSGVNENVSFTLNATDKLS